MSEHSGLAKAISHDVVEANISKLPKRSDQYLSVREKVDAILEAYPEYDYRKLRAAINQLEARNEHLVRDFNLKCKDFDELESRCKELESLLKHHPFVSRKDNSLNLAKKVD